MRSRSRSIWRRADDRLVDEAEALEQFLALRDLSATVDNALQEAATGLRAFGYTWFEIAGRLGVSRQAVQMRWGQRDP